MVLIKSATRAPCFLLGLVAGVWPSLPRGMARIRPTRDAYAVAAYSASGGGRQIWFASVLRFCTIAARWRGGTRRMHRRPRNRNTLKAMMGLQVRKSHLDSLALVTRFVELRRAHPCARYIARILMHVARNLSEGHIRSALGLEVTRAAIARAGATKNGSAVVDPAGCWSGACLRDRRRRCAPCRT